MQFSLIFKSSVMIHHEITDEDKHQINTPAISSSIREDAHMMNNSTRLSISINKSF